MDEQKNEELKKRVDESWKNSVEKEKGSAGAEMDKLPEVTFALFASTLIMEALMALGEAENPVTKKKEINTVHAKFIIDVITMLQEKTKNNISKDEADMLDSALYDLRMRFISKTGK